MRKSTSRFIPALICLALLLALGPAAAAASPVLTLPDGLKTVETEAFCGDTSLREVVIPDGTESIGPRAFADSGVTWISIPDSVTAIGEGAFSGAENVTVISNESAYAHAYAAANGIAWENANPPAPTPDSDFWQWAVKEFDTDGNGVLSQDELDAVTSINCAHQELKSLEGIEYFRNLQELDCSGNTISSLDVSENLALTMLNCRSNWLGVLDVSQNTALTELYCSSNYFTSLDVSQNTALTALECGGYITSLDVSQNIALESLSCNNTQLTSLDLSHNTALITLNCSSCALTNLDLSHNVKLRMLWCYDNPLTSLNVSRCPALEELHCTRSRLTSLNLSHNPALTLVMCGNNQLTSLDLSGCQALTQLICYGNRLTSLDVSDCTALFVLACFNNQLTSLDISGSHALETMRCNDNQLTDLDLSQSHKLSELRCKNNQLTTIDVAECWNGIKVTADDGVKVVYTHKEPVLPPVHPTPAPTPEPPPAATPDPTGHVHDWQPVYITVHHDAGTYESYYKDVAPTCTIVHHDGYNQCGLCGFTTSDEKIIGSHCLEDDSNWWTYGSWDETVWSGGEGHYETITLWEAYDEEVLTGYTCACGATWP